MRRSLYNRLLAILMCQWIFFLFAGPAMALDDVKVHTSGSTSANVLIYKIAQERGYLQRRGIERFDDRGDLVGRHPGTRRRKF